MSILAARSRRTSYGLAAPQGTSFPGLAPNATQFFIGSGRGANNNYRTRAISKIPSPQMVFCVNQLSGVGASRSQFKIRGLNNPDGVHCKSGPYKSA